MNMHLLKLFRKVNKYFKNRRKTRLWFITDNPLLNNAKPINRIDSKRLLQLIEKSLWEHGL